VFDWNDLKYLLALARQGSTIAAGKALGVSQSTVHRRIGELEASLGRPLVIRKPSGYRLTDFGERIRAYAERVEVEIRGIERDVGSAARDHGGVIRVTCPEPIVHRILPLIGRFHARYPGLRVEFVMSDRYLDLSKGEADVAFRSGDTDDDLVGRKIAASVWAVYASQTYLEQFGKPQRVEQLAQHKLVNFDEKMSDHRVAKWLKAVAPEADIVARNNSVLGLVYAVKSGIGLGPLPTAIADAEPGLVRVLGPIPELCKKLAPPDASRPQARAAYRCVL
jgi:DNA-binding transcriptional LysR family regulator